MQISKETQFSFTVANSPLKITFPLILETVHFRLKLILDFTFETEN